MKGYNKASFWVFLLILSVLILEVSCTKNIPSVSQEISPTKNTLSTVNTPTLEEFHFPIDGSDERVTKKTFWLNVSPKNSPVSPEKFTGYHTGADFETFPTEKDIEVTVRAICSGPLILKKWATGYGGVVVQKCELNKETVTVVYGHLKIDSVVPEVRAEFKTGDMLGTLGKWYSFETDGERKHLHLSIHKWPVINIRGYVATRGELSEWLDPVVYLK